MCTVCFTLNTIQGIDQAVIQLVLECEKPSLMKELLKNIIVVGDVANIQYFTTVLNTRIQQVWQR